MSIITVLASLATVGARNAVYAAREATLKEDLFRMRDAIDQYYADKGKYPADLQALVTDQYMREVPVDPISNSRDSWQTIPAEPDPQNPSAEPGDLQRQERRRRHLAPGPGLQRVLGRPRGGARRPVAGAAARAIAAWARAWTLQRSPAERPRSSRGFAQWRAC